MPSRITSSSSGSQARGARWSWLLPAGTFLAGCLLGGVVMGVGDVGTDDGPGSSAAVSADAGSDDAADDAADGGATGQGGDRGEPGDVTVRVPASCVRAAEDATALVESVDQVVAAVADLDPRTLRRTVDDVQQVRDGVREVAAQCREAAAERQQATSGTDDDAAPAAPGS